MGSDRARVSYDPSRHWRGVISQQGRVTLEADWNEAAAIAAAERRAELIDLIGPAGTPDDGYAVTAVTDPQSGAATGDLTIGAGTMYVGGERMTLEADLDYADQPDWTDHEGDQLWVDPATQQGDEAVYLLLREQEVGAVEDPALLDVALGGPDTSGRWRIIQRVVRGAVDQTTCAGALGELEQSWAELGLQFDPATMRLRSGATLQVGFQQEPGPASPCDPVAQGGYLGAENQLIRVQVASVDNGVPTLVWGFDNAYFLYRLQIASTDTAAGTTTITLASPPIDSYHQPAAGQAVEVLRSAAQVTAVDYIAATSGLVTAVTADGAYRPDTQQLTIGTALAPPVTDDESGTPKGPPLYLRVWQDTVQYTGGPVALGDTGVTVTLAPGPDGYHAGDYWAFAVRPGTPETVSPVYPQRILDAPQPPDGPRLWACPLAVVAWADGVPSITDCRVPFPSSGSDGGCCCTVELTPADVDAGAGLQALLERLARQGPVTICLAPGTYTLLRPLVIPPVKHPVTIQGCGGEVVLTAGEEDPQIFELGLVIVDSATGVTLRGLTFALPRAQFAAPAAAFAGLPAELQRRLEAYGSDLTLSIGVYLLRASDVTIADCTFQFPGTTGASVFGAGVYAARAIDGLTITGCAFTAAEVAQTPFSELARLGAAEPPFEVRFGYLQVPTAVSKLVGTRPALEEASAGAEAWERVGALSDVVAQTTLAAPAQAGDTIVYPASVAGMSAGDSVEIDTGDAQETGTIDAVGKGAGSATTLLGATQAGATVVVPASVAGMAVGDMLLIDSGTNAELATIARIILAPVTVVSRVSVQLTAPLTLVHAAGAPVLDVGTGITLDAGVAAAHAVGAALVDEGKPVPPQSVLGSLADAVVERNLFDGVTVALLVLAQAGTVRIEDNTVRECYGGFWLLTAATNAIVDLLDRLAAGGSGVVTGASGLSSLVDPVLLFATAIARVLPIAPSAQPSTIEEPNLASLAVARELLAQVYSPDDEPAPAPGPQGGGAQEPAAKDSATTKPSRTRSSTRAAQAAGADAASASVLPAQLAGLFTDVEWAEPAEEVVAVDAGTGLIARVQLSANQIDAILADADSAAGLLVANLDTTPAGLGASLVCDANRVRSRVVQGPAVNLFRPAECTVTGNVVGNEIPDTQGTLSIVLVPAPAAKVPLVAVTGNVLIGSGERSAILPGRAVAAPLNVWDPLNTIAEYIQGP